jgi:hypothetical protein
MEACVSDEAPIGARLMLGGDTGTFGDFSWPEHWVN